MLLKILLLRMTPMIVIGRVKERKKIKLIITAMIMIVLMLSLFSAAEIFKQKHWSGLVYLILSMLPHGIFYLLSFGFMSRCIWKMWSKRVWKRVYIVSIILVIVGILLEMYVNPRILEKLLKNFI